jgi:hypothetical protein
MRLGARVLAAGRVEMIVTGLEDIPTDGPGPFGCPPLSSSFRRCCAVTFRAAQAATRGIRSHWTGGKASCHKDQGQRGI